MHMLVWVAVIICFTETVKVMRRVMAGRKGERRVRLSEIFLVLSAYLLPEGQPVITEVCFRRNGVHTQCPKPAKIFT